MTNIVPIEMNVFVLCRQKPITITYDLDKRSICNTETMLYVDEENDVAFESQATEFKPS